MTIILSSWKGLRTLRVHGPTFWEVPVQPSQPICWGHVRLWAGTCALLPSPPTWSEQTHVIVSNVIELIPSHVATIASVFSFPSILARKFQQFHRLRWVHALISDLWNGSGNFHHWRAPAGELSCVLRPLDRWTHRQTTGTSQWTSMRKG